MRELANKLAKQLVEEQKLHLKRPKKLLSVCRFCKKRARYMSTVKYDKKLYAIYTGMLLTGTTLKTQLGLNHFYKTFRSKFF